MRKMPAAGDCCEFRAKKRQEKIKRDARLRKSQRKARDECGNVVKSKAKQENQLKSTKCYNLKRKSRTIKKPEKCPLNADYILNRIKPSYDEREKYFNPQHILCILKENEVLKITNLRKIREKEKKIEDLCEDDADNKTDVKSCNSEDEQLQKKKTLNSDEKKSGFSTRRLKNKNACPSICSLDSDIDLTEFALTKEDIDHIENNKKQHAVKQNDENEVDNIQAEESLI